MPNPPSYDELLLSCDRRRATPGNTRIVLGGTVGAEYTVTIFIRPSKMPILFEPQCCLQSVPKSNVEASLYFNFYEYKLCCAPAPYFYMRMFVVLSGVTYVLIGDY